jgi:hypothetical protein
VLSVTAVLIFEQREVRGMFLCLAEGIRVSYENTLAIFARVRLSERAIALELSNQSLTLKNVQVLHSADPQP